MEEFKYNIQDIAKTCKMRKDNIISNLKKWNIVENVDFIKITQKKEKPSKGQPSYTYMITEKMYNQLIAHICLYSRRNIENIDIQLDYVKRYIPKEIEILGFVYDIFSPIYKLNKQYIIKPYRVDLYIEDINIAIECDEFDHKNRDKIYENKRELFIKEKLNCTFYRFNPDASDFKLSTIIRDLHVLLK